MTLSPLSDSQRARLAEELDKFLVSMSPVPPREAESETAYTGRVLLPAVQAWVRGLRTPALYCRGDGGAAVLPVRWLGSDFFPDIEITLGPDLEIAFEVKFLRSIDTTGSVAKAIGQAVVYSNCGFHLSAALLIDIRQPLPERSLSPVSHSHVNPRVSYWHFSQHLSS